MKTLPAIVLGLAACLAVLAPTHAQTPPAADPQQAIEAQPWLPKGVSWRQDVHSLTSRFSLAEMTIMAPADGAPGGYTGVMAGRTPAGYMFTFFEDQLVGVCVAFEARHPDIPAIGEIDTDAGYTKIYRSRAEPCTRPRCQAGNWVIIESGLKGYQVFTWDKNLGIKALTPAR